MAKEFKEAQEIDRKAAKERKPKGVHSNSFNLSDSVRQSR
jgi:hypothetical protein